MNHRDFTCWRGAVVAFGVSVTLAAPHVCAAQTPDACKAPASLEAAMHATPTAQVYDAAGAWFAQRKKMECALAAFQKAVQLQPHVAEAQYNLGLAQLATGRRADAEKHLREAINEDPGMFPAHESLGMLLLDAGKPAEAESEFHKAIDAGDASSTALDNLAMSLAAQQRYTAAINYWEQALAKQPSSPDILLSLGQARYKSGDKKGSLLGLRKLAAQYPQRGDIHLALADVLAQELLYTEAAEQFGIAVQLDPKNDGAVLSWAKALSDSGSYQAALPPAERYVQRHPEDPEGQFVLGSIERRLGNYSQAEQHLTLALAHRADDPDICYELGLAYARDDQPERALPYLERTHSLRPQDAPTDFALSGVLRKLGKQTRAKEVTGALLESNEQNRQASRDTVDGSQANMYLQNGQPQKAAALYREMLARDPNNARTSYNLALALAAMHDTKGERGALERAISIDPKMAVAQGELGFLDLSAGDRVHAQQRLETALALDPGLATAQGNLGLLYAMRGDGRTAEQMFRRAIEDDPNYGQAYLNLGLMLASREDFKDAEPELVHSLKLMPGNPRVQSALGKVEVRLGKIEEALALLRSNVELAPGSAEAHLELAIALADTYNLKGALAETDRAIELAPGSGPAHLNRGRILLDLGQLQDARQSLEQAIRLQPSAVDARFYLALVEKQQGHREAAAGLFKTVLQQQPENLTALYDLGECLQPTDAAAAIQVWRGALKINPDYVPALWSLSRALKPLDAGESAKYATQLQAALSKAHRSDAAELAANRAIASMQAHDWPAAFNGFNDAIQICGECSDRASLHKALGLAYCQAGDLIRGQAELQTAERLQPADPEVRRALALVAGAGQSPKKPSPAQSR